MKRLIALSAVIGLLSPFAAYAKPIIGPVTPITTAAGTPVNLSATVSSSISIQRCSLWVDLAEIGDMVVSDGKATRVYTFPSGGSRIAFVFCRDTSGGMAAGATTAINVSGATQVSPPLSTPAPLPVPENPVPVPNPIPLPENPVEPVMIEQPVSPDAGKLLKAFCPSDAAVDHPCHAIYYIGKDGNRHAFPNSRVFFTWYGGFDGVQEVSIEKLAEYTLGTNVQYRAGIKMVKFITDPKVYAVARGGILRWITSEELASAYYGNEWNKKIDDISDTFYNNYTFGDDIRFTSDYNPLAETQNSGE